MGCKIAQVILIVCILFGHLLFVKESLRDTLEKRIEFNQDIQEISEESQKKIAAEYKPYTDFYLEYSDFSDIEKSSDLVQQKILEYNAWFLEKQKSFVLGELSEQEEKILEKIELIQNNPQLRKDNQNE